MLNLIKKDFIFTKKYLLVLLVYLALVPGLLIIDGDQKYYFATFFIPFCTGAFLVGKICSIEDSTDTRIMLKLLPYSKYTRIGARYLFLLSVLGVSYGYLLIVQSSIFNLGNIRNLASQNMIMIFAFVVYFSIYLSIFYHFGHFMAQNTIYFLMVLVGGGTFIKNNIGLEFDFMNLFNGISPVVTTSIFIGIIIVIYLSACIGEKVEI